jgi:hypothetical protein
MSHPHFAVKRFYRKSYVEKGRDSRTEIDGVEGDTEIRQVHGTGTLRTGLLSFISHLPGERGTPSHVLYTHTSHNSVTKPLHMLCKEIYY